MERKNNKKVSLLIPAYNEEKYIGACLDSIISNAPHSFYEIIVIDNASTDKTAKIVAYYRKHNVRIVKESHKGLTWARQRGFIEATGDILAFVDADTRMEYGWYEKIIQAYTYNTNIACLSGPYVYYDASALYNILVKMYWYLLALPSYWIIGYMLVGGNFAIRRDVLEKMGGFDTSIPFYGEDTNIARRAARFGKVKFDITFKMPTSARRFFGESLFKAGNIYILSFLSETFLHRPVVKKYKDIR